MDASLFGNVKKTYKTNGLEDILKEEENLAKQANDKKDMAKIAVYLIIIDTFLIIVCPIIWYRKKKKEFEASDFDGEYYRKIPEDYGPAVMAELLGIMEDTRVGPAIIMNLARKGHIKITEIKNDKDNVQDFELELIDKEELEKDETVMDNERYFALNILFDRETKFALEDFKKRFSTSSEQSAAVDKKDIWQKKIKEDAKARGLIRSKTSPFKGCWRVNFNTCVYVSYNYCIW